MLSPRVKGKGGKGTVMGMSVGKFVTTSSDSSVSLESLSSSSSSSTSSWLLLDTSGKCWKTFIIHQASEHIYMRCADLYLACLPRVYALLRSYVHELLWICLTLPEALFYLGRDVTTRTAFDWGKWVLLHTGCPAALNWHFAVQNTYRLYWNIHAFFWRVESLKTT